MIRPEDVAEVCATLRAAASDGQPVSATRVVVRRDVLVRAADLLGDLAAEVWLSDAVTVTCGDGATEDARRRRGSL